MTRVELEDSIRLFNLIYWTLWSDGWPEAIRTTSPAAPAASGKNTVGMCRSGSMVTSCSSGSAPTASRSDCMAKECRLTGGWVMDDFDCGACNLCERSKR